MQKTEWEERGFWGREKFVSKKIVRVGKKKRIRQCKRAKEILRVKKQQVEENLQVKNNTVNSASKKWELGYCREGETRTEMADFGRSCSTLLTRGNSWAYSSMNWLHDCFDIGICRIPLDPNCKWTPMKTKSSMKMEKGVRPCHRCGARFAWDMMNPLFET